MKQNNEKRKYVNPEEMKTQCCLAAVHREFLSRACDSAQGYQ
jgi:hypothetical protein